MQKYTIYTGLPVAPVWGLRERLLSSLGTPPQSRKRNIQQYAKMYKHIHKHMQTYAKIYRNKQKYANICKNMQKYIKYAKI